MVGSDIAVSVSEFVASLNQTLDFTYPAVVITGELANFRVAKGKWVYFDIKDEGASIKGFGTVYQIPGPLEDGMVVAVRAVPRLHPLYGFSLNVQTVRPVGEGSIKKAAQLLQAKLTAEGLFDDSRKRPLPHPPRHIGLVASYESAAFRDFMKIMNARWSGVEVTMIDVQVQGEAAPAQITAAITQLNGLAGSLDVIVITRGGGSPEDLQAFSTEQVTRAVAASRIPTLVAIGHEVDVSLAELAADKRASTPSNAAELLVPDRQAIIERLHLQRTRLTEHIDRLIAAAREALVIERTTLAESVEQVIFQARNRLALQRQIARAYDPHAALKRGYAIIRKESAVRSGNDVHKDDVVDIELTDARLTARIERVIMKTGKNDGAKN